MRRVFMVNTGVGERWYFPWWRWTLCLKIYHIGGLMTSAGWRQSCNGHLWIAACSGCQCIHVAASLLSSPTRLPWPWDSTGPRAKATERKTTTSSKTNLLSPYPLCKNKWLPGVSPGQRLFVFIGVDSQWGQHGKIWGKTCLNSRDQHKWLWQTGEDETAVSSAVSSSTCVFVSLVLCGV